MRRLAGTRDALPVWLGNLQPGSALTVRVTVTAMQFPEPELHIDEAADASPENDGTALPPDEAAEAGAFGTRPVPLTGGRGLAYAQGQCAVVGGRSRRN